VELMETNLIPDFQSSVVCLIASIIGSGINGNYPNVRKHFESFDGIIEIASIIGSGINGNGLVE